MAILTRRETHARLYLPKGRREKATGREGQVPTGYAMVTKKRNQSTHWLRYDRQIGSDVGPKAEPA